MSADAERPPSFALTALMAGNVAIGLGVLAPAALINDLSLGFSLPPAEVGRLVVYGAIVLFVAAPTLAFLTNRLDRRWLLTGCLALFVTGHALSAFAPTFEALLALRLMMIAAAAVYTPQAASALALFVPMSGRTAAVTYVFLGWALATAFGLPLLTLIGAQAGWRMAYGFIALASALSLAAVWITVPRGLRTPKLSIAAWRRVGANPAILLVLAVTSVQLIGQFTVFPYIAAELKRVLALPATQIALTLGLYGVAGVIGSAIATRLAPRIGAPNGVLICLGAVSLGLLIWALGPTDLLGAAAFVFVWGLGFSAGVSLQQARLIAIAPDLASASVALNTSVLYLGQALGAAAGRGLLTAERPDLLGWVGLGFVLAAAGLSLAATQIYRA